MSVASRKPPAPLAGVRVLALEHFIAGPWCSQILADAGAEVVKVERPGVGDPRRWYDPYAEVDGQRVSGGFASYNRSKKSVVVDMTTDEGREQFLRLVDDADVIVENLRPGLMDRMKLGYDELNARNPRLIYCAISGFGRLDSHRGEFADWPAFDPIVQALGGLSSLMGDKDGPPQLAPAGSMDLLTGTWAAMSVLMALLQRANTGRGQFLDAAMYDVAATFVGRPLMIYEWVGEVMTRGVDGFTPVGVFECGNGGHVALILPTDEMWYRTCAAIDRPDLLDHPALSTVLARSEAMNAVIVPALVAWASEMSHRGACDLLAGAGVPAGMVQSIDEVYNCRHLAARSMFVELDDPIAGPHTYPRFPVLFSNYEPEYLRSPLLGEHNTEYLSARADPPASSTAKEGALE
jgi:crotonobetainyl-CoA:carnitine CoA-transferase CaiB-like acyl-CoA transferase